MTIQSIIQSISDKRISTYKKSHFKEDDIQSVGGYLWNKLLCANLLPPLQLIEVSLRNALYYGYINNQIQQLMSEGKTEDEAKQEVDLFWFKTEALKVTSRPESKRHIDMAEHQLNKDNKAITPDNLISKLPLGFWVSFCRPAYSVNQEVNIKLWPTIRNNVFPNAKKENGNALSISEIGNKLTYINSIRNRLAHHEPIWNDKNHYSIENSINKIARIYFDCLTVINWINDSNSKVIRLIENDIKYAELCILKEVERYKSLPQDIDKVDKIDAAKWFSNVEVQSRHDGVITYKNTQRNFVIIKSSKNNADFYAAKNKLPNNRLLDEGTPVNFEPMSALPGQPRARANKVREGHL
ncbi:Abi family protein [Pseudoalteromonas phenolica]|uniref:Abi family protein n=1 Tax=Pseudoalteromonas phenolica TaxID=161398 RepID=UPI00110A1C7C|nr:Abi family protein [Pseudoalteromonas phenolica]TMO54442.1 hypothetical protein CWC21_15050 [Pseudoalteromonas phenolica]